MDRIIREYRSSIKDLDKLLEDIREYKNNNHIKTDGPVEIFRRRLENIVNDVKKTNELVRGEAGIAVAGFARAEIVGTIAITLSIIASLIALVRYWEEHRRRFNKKALL